MEESVHLVIVESAAKAKTIESYLRSIPALRARGTWKVMACLGHVRDLPAKELGVDKTTWDVNYVPLPAKREVLQRLKKAAREAHQVYLASDPDREGSAIAFHLRECLGVPAHKMQRVQFHEITPSALERAFKVGASICMDEVHAQETRRVLDRLVGYEVSPLLWRRFSSPGLSAGRVQSAALRMIVDRAVEGEQYKLDVFWTARGVFTMDPMGSLEGKAMQGKEPATWPTAAEAEAWVAALTDAKRRRVPWTASFHPKRVQKNPSAPFITSTLQQEAYARYKMPAKRTMQLAQALYEAGLITYMRTDSPAMSMDAVTAVHVYIEETYGADLKDMHTYKSKNQFSQEAHECIRPCKILVTADALDTETWSASHQKLYDLIWRRAVASQMTPSEHWVLSYDLQQQGQEITFHGSRSFLAKEGFLRVWSPEQAAQTEEIKRWEGMCASSPAPNGDARLVELHAEADASRPMSLFHEPSLIQALEKRGIGRPSTYATILEKLFQKAYIVHGQNPQHTQEVRNFHWVKDKQPLALIAEKAEVRVGGKETDRLVPTPLGTRVLHYLEEATPFLLDPEFTARMEADLDRISQGHARKKDTLDAFSASLDRAVNEARERHKGEKREGSGGGPSVDKIARRFEDLDTEITQTRYGWALYVRGGKRFLSLAWYLDWKQKAVEDITREDVQLLCRFPLSVEGTTRVVHIGPYGLYVKDGGKNLRFPKENWDTAVEGHLTAAALDACIANGVASGGSGARKIKSSLSSRFRKTTPCESP